MCHFDQLHTTCGIATCIHYNKYIRKGDPTMPKEMLFLCDVYTKWLEDNELPHRCASDLLYGKDTMNKLRINQIYWLENFI